MNLLFPVTIFIFIFINFYYFLLLFHLFLSLLWNSVSSFLFGSTAPQQRQQNGKRHRGLQKHKHKQLTFSPPIDWFFPPAAVHFVLLTPRCSLTPFILLFLLPLFSGSYNSNTIQPGWTTQTEPVLHPSIRCCFPLAGCLPPRRPPISDAGSAERVMPSENCTCMVG